MVGSGGTSADTSGNGGDAGGDSDPRCSVVWGTPKADPSFNGLRGTLNGQPLDSSDADATVSYCAADGPPATPNLRTYVSLPGMSLWFDATCGARVTTPNETDWHQLEIELSATVTKSAPPNVGGYVENVRAIGHVRLEGQSLDGPFSLDADFDLAVGIVDPCILPPG